MAYLEVRVAASVFTRNMRGRVGWIAVPIVRRIFHVQVFDRPFTGGDDDIWLLEYYDHSDSKPGETRWWL